MLEDPSVRTPSPAMLELRALRYQAATAAEPVLRDASLQLEAGKPALVAGRSGSGSAGINSSNVSLNFTSCFRALGSLTSLTAFGSGAEHYLRMCFARKPEDMREATRRLAAVLSR